MSMLVFWSVIVNFIVLWNQTSAIQTIENEKKIICLGEEAAIGCQQSKELRINSVNYQVFNSKLKDCKFTMNSTHHKIPCENNNMTMLLQKRCFNETICNITEIVRNMERLCQPFVYLVVDFSCWPKGYIVGTPRPSTSKSQPTDSPQTTSEIGSSSFALELFWFFFELYLLVEYLKGHTRSLFICLLCSTAVGIICLILMIIIVEYASRNFGYFKRKKRSHEISSPMLVIHDEEEGVRTSLVNKNDDNEDIAEPSTCLLRLDGRPTRVSRASSRASSSDVFLTTLVDARNDRPPSTRLARRPRGLSASEEHELDDLIDTMRHFSDTLETSSDGTNHMGLHPFVSNNNNNNNNKQVSNAIGFRPQSCSPSLRSFRNQSNQELNNQAARYIPIERYDGTTVSNNTSDDVRVYPVPLPHNSPLRHTQTNKSNSSKNIHNVSHVIPPRTIRSTSDSGTYRIT